jgi:hypothetical protein
MGKYEAKQVLAKALETYRQRSYQELQYLLETQDTAEVTTDTGKLYQLEFQAVWDDREEGDLRIIGSIDDGGWRAYMPLTDSFIISPTGEFVDE